MNLNKASKNTISFAKRHSQFLKFFARWGYAARALVYLIVGFFAFTAAFGKGPVIDPKGALLTLFKGPLGSPLLWAVAFGLLSYSLWRFVQGSLNADNHDRDLKGYVIRCALIISSITHLSLAYWAGYLAVYHRRQNSSSSGEWIGWLMEQTGGQLVVVLIACCILGAGIAQFIKSYKASFLKFCGRLRSHKTIVHLCRTGIFARGVVFGLLSYLFFQIAFYNSDKNSSGLAEALTLIQRQNMGWLFLAIMGLGLICFSLYSAAQAYCREIKV